MIHLHKWYAVTSHKCIDVNYGTTHTLVLCHCKRCDKVKTKVIDGGWEFEQVAPSKSKENDGQ